MLKYISIKNKAFKADTSTRNPVTGEYRDPLMKWPLRGAAFTNEVGEALRPLIGNAATLTWIPALLYIGADVYDKYKNDQIEYSPNSKRCLKQACFQGLASILLPIFAVKGGQNLFSLFGLLTKNKISFNVQEHILKLAQDFVANGKLHAYKNKDEEWIKEFLNIVENNIDYKKYKTSINKNPFKDDFYNMFKINTKENINKYAEESIKELVNIRKKLLNTKNLPITDKTYSAYLKALKSGQTRNAALKNVLNKVLNTKGTKGRIVKTIGGFIALGLAIKPIDNFVENVLIGKVIGPGIDKTKTPTF